MPLPDSIRAAYIGRVTLTASDRSQPDNTIDSLREIVNDARADRRLPMQEYLLISEIVESWVRYLTERCAYCGLQRGHGPTSRCTGLEAGL